MTIRRYTDNELWIAAELFKLGFSWQEIAEQLRCKQPNLYEAVRRVFPELRGRCLDRPDSRASDLVLIYVKARLAAINQEIEAAGENRGRVERLKMILEARVVEAENGPPCLSAQHRSRCARQAVVLRLLELGLGSGSIERLTGYRQQTVKEDIRAAGFRSTGMSRAEVYRAVFREYVGLRGHQGHVSEFIEDTRWYVGLLKQYLRIPEILGYLLGVEETLRVLERIERTLEQEPYVRLWEDLCSLERSRYSYKRAERVVEAVWDTFVSAVEDGEVPSPTDAREAARFAATQMRAGRRDNVWPAWRDEWSQLIEAMFSRLTERQRFMVRMRYGFDSAPASLRRIGDLTGLSSTERLRQIIQIALINLRKTDEFRLLAAQAVPLSCLQEAVEKAATELAEMNERIRQMRTEVIVLADGRRATFRNREMDEVLFKRVDEFEFSVRAANCLQNSGTEFVWQLVLKTELEMLKTKNFGRKSLNEIRELLAEIGLSLNMKLPAGDYPWNAAGVVP